MSKQATIGRTEVGVLASSSPEPRRMPWQPPSIEDSSIALTTEAKLPTGGEFFTLSKGGS